MFRADKRPGSKAKRAKPSPEMEEEESVERNSSGTERLSSPEVDLAVLKEKMRRMAEKRKMKKKAEEKAAPAPESPAEEDVVEVDSGEDSEQERLQRAWQKKKKNKSSKGESSGAAKAKGHWAAKCPGESSDFGILAYESGGKEKWDGERSKREKDEYDRLLQAKIDPMPRAHMVYARDEATMEDAQTLLRRNVANDLAIHVGAGERPLYIVFVKVRVLGLTPHLTLLHTGEFTDEEMRNKFGWQEDNLQPNKPPRPSFNYPYISNFKTQLGFPDLEMIRGKGALLLRRTHEIAQAGAGQKAEVYSLDPDIEEDAAPAAENLRLKIFRDSLGVTMLQLFRVGKALLGTPVEVQGSRFVLRPDEFGNIIKCVDEIYKEGCRLASTRQSTYQSLTGDIRRGFDTPLMEVLFERVKRAGLEEEGDPLVLFDFVARFVRCRTSTVLKRILNPSKGTKDVFQAYHLEMCSTEQIRDLCSRVQKMLQSGE